MTMRALRTFQPGDLIRLEVTGRLLVIVHQGDMGTTVQPVEKHSRDFTGWDNGAGVFRRVSFQSKKRVTVLAGTAPAELVKKGAADDGQV